MNSEHLHTTLRGICNFQRDSVLSKHLWGIAEPRVVLREEKGSGWAQPCPHVVQRPQVSPHIADTQPMCFLSHFLPSVFPGLNAALSRALPTPAPLSAPTRSSAPAALPNSTQCSPFPDRLTTLFRTDTHPLLLCCVSTPFAGVYIFITQRAASGLVYHASNPLLNREYFLPFAFYLLSSSPGAAALRSIREGTDSRGAL